MSSSILTNKIKEEGGHFEFTNPSFRVLLVSAFLSVALLLTGNNSFAQTQSVMRASTLSDFKKADNALNTTYQKILKEYADKKMFIAKIKAAQRLWLQLRDADLDARYPDRGKYGSAELMCRAAFLEAATKERIKVLRVWIDGVSEGDVCNGSVKRK